MPKFLNSDMAELAHQLTISPRRLRIEQIREIENLLAVVEPDRAYPFEFVCFRITQFRKRGPETGASIPGNALVIDLVTMAEAISRKANLTAAELADSFLTHQQLAEELQVSTKTVRRWRDRGLMGIRVVFADGVNRLAFCRSTVDRFVSRNRALVAKGAAFKQLSDAEREQIVARARELLSQKPLRLHAASKLIAEEMSRAVETVRYTLRRHDELRRGEPLFARNGEPVRCERQMTAWSLHERGESADAIAQALGLDVVDARAAIRGEQIRRWKETPLEYIPNELFDAPNADELILDAPEPVASDISNLKVPRDVPPYLRSLYLTPLLTADIERDLFRRYNYLKHRTAKRLRELDPAVATDRQVDEVRSALAQIDEFKQRIIRANLRLVVSIAKKHVGWSANFFEVVSDGNVSLMRAVEKFDYARGCKFSTYATWAVVKNYARSIPEQHYHAARFVTGQDLVLDAVEDHRDVEAHATDRQQVRTLINVGLTSLTERERDILSCHFGMTDDGGSPLTLEQLGRRFGVTKERIRQIEQRALARLRELLAPTLADAI